jgi:hypothetical protein
LRRAAFAKVSTAERWLAKIVFNTGDYAKRPVYLQVASQHRFENDESL